MQRLHHFCNIHNPDHGQDWAENTWEIINYVGFINRFQLDIIKSMRQLERFNKKFVDKNVYNVQSNMYQ